MKTCSKCFTEKEKTDFPKDKNRKDGLLSWCLKCNNHRYREYYKQNANSISKYTSKWNKKNRAKLTEAQRLKRRANLDKFRDSEYRRKYGITLDQYNAMLLNQNYECKICKNANQKLFVDHCHSTGKVRGLICNSCNKALGLFKDKAEVLLRAAQYLTEKL